MERQCYTCVWVYERVCRQLAEPSTDDQAALTEIANTRPLRRDRTSGKTRKTARFSMGWRRDPDAAASIEEASSALLPEEMRSVGEEKEACSPVNRRLPRRNQHLVRHRKTHPGHSKTCCSSRSST